MNYIYDIRQSYIDEAIGYDNATAKTTQEIIRC